MTIPFAEIADLAARNATEICRRWLPDGQLRGREWYALNPRREDRHLGSFAVNVHTGRWADFAIGMTGADLIDLAEYLYDLRPAEAARRVAAMVGHPFGQESARE